MRRQSYSSSLGGGNDGNGGSGGGEPQIIVEESSTLGEEETDRGRNESPPRSLDSDSSSWNPYLLSPWRETTRKHSLPTPQCTSGITASQVRRLSERGGEGSGPSAMEAAFLATLSQAPAPQPGGSGRRHSVVTISRVPPTFFGRNRRESIAAFPLGGTTRLLSGRRDSQSGIAVPPSNAGSTHNLQLDIMDDIAEMKAKKVRLKMYKTSTEQVCEIQPLEGNSAGGSSDGGCGTTSSIAAQRYTQYQKRRFSEASGATSLASVPRGTTTAAGIVCSNTDLISILSSLTSSATEINRCGDEDQKGGKVSSFSSVDKTVEQKRGRLKSFRSNSFDVSILHGGAKGKLAATSKMAAAAVTSSIAVPPNWFMRRHQPMSKKQRSENEEAATAGLNVKFDKSKVVKTVKETLARTSPIGAGIRHNVLWDDTSGTKVDAQVLGSAIEKILTAQKGGSGEGEAAGSSGKMLTSPSKPKASKVAGWFSAGNKEQEQGEASEPSICSSLKDLFVK